MGLDLREYIYIYWRKKNDWTKMGTFVLLKCDRFSLKRTQASTEKLQSMTTHKTGEK